MKKNFTFQILVLLFFAFTVSAQQGINYKAIINAANGDILANTVVTIQFTILENGTTNVYQESHNPTTDHFGIIIVNIGDGTPVNGDFNTIDWGSNPHFLKTEIDAGDGLTDMGTTEFKAVPYALHSKTAEDAATKAYVDQLLARLDQLESGIIDLNSVIDFDNDDFTIANGDCDDRNSSVYPGAYDVCGDGIDQDCDGSDRACITTVTDIEGNEYDVVEIGFYFYWMAENLRTATLNDGTPIPLVEDENDWQVPGTPKYCWYENSGDIGAIYGALYNWHTVESNKLCPAGWHVPDLWEWSILEDFMGGSQTAGGALKEVGTIHWNDPNIGATNSVGFTALPGGGRSSLGPFSSSLGRYGHFWTSTMITDQAYEFYMINGSPELMHREMAPNSALSVRCIKYELDEEIKK